MAGVGSLPHQRLGGARATPISCWTRRDRAGTPQGALIAVSADASGDAWAAGQATAGDGTGLLLHWTGARWLEHSGPPNSESLEGVSSLSGSLVATVGQSTGDSGIRAIWNGHRWQI